jgi:hypothetical protein
MSFMGRPHRVKQNKSAARRRRRETEGRHGWHQVKVVEGPPLGEGVVTASLDDVLRAMKKVSPDLDWPSVADQVVPLFQRVRPYEASMPEPFRMVVPPGLTISFGIDIGPAFMAVSDQLLEQWDLTEDQLLDRALANLDRRIAGVSARDIVDSPIGDVPVRMLQSSTGSASTYVLRPARLARIFGPEPILVIAPMRNLLMAMPVDVDRDFASLLFDEIASQDPNCLAPAAFIVGNGTLTIEPLGDAFGVA